MTITSHPPMNQSEIRTLICRTHVALQHPLNQQHHHSPVPGLCHKKNPSHTWANISTYVHHHDSPRCCKSNFIHHTPRQEVVFYPSSVHGISQTRQHTPPCFSQSARVEKKNSWVSVSLLTWSGWNVQSKCQHISLTLCFLSKKSWRRTSPFVNIRHRCILC